MGVDLRTLPGWRCRQPIQIPTKPKWREILPARGDARKRMDKWFERLERNPPKVVAKVKIFKRAGMSANGGEFKFLVLASKKPFSDGRYHVSYTYPESELKKHVKKIEGDLSFVVNVLSSLPHGDRLIRLVKKVSAALKDPSSFKPPVEKHDFSEERVLETMENIFRILDEAKSSEGQ